MSSNLSRTHGSLEGGEAAVEGAKNGDNVVCNGLALLESLSHHGCSLA